MNVSEYLDFETERQSGTPAERIGMRTAYDLLLPHQEITENLILDMARALNGQTAYRRQPVYFRHGGHAINWQSVPRAMESLVEAINSTTQADFVKVEVGYTVSQNRADLLTKEFLDIHPFLDGNGRLASLLRNWMLDTMDNPSIMPYYFGEN